MSKNHEAFVYLWRDSVNKKFYLGYHKGSPDDNYAHSSSLMESFTMNNVPNGFKRRILAVGSNEEMMELELKLLKNRKERGRWDKYYNINYSTYPYLWDDPEHRKKVSHSTKEQWKDPEYRKARLDDMSSRMKGQWKDPDFRESCRKNTSARLKEQWKDPEYRQYQSELMKSRWKDPEFRIMQAGLHDARMKKLWKDPEYRKNHAERTAAWSKEMWNDPERRSNVCASMKARWKDPEYLEKMKAIFKNNRAVCSVCGHESTKSTITRWHNDNCKFKKDEMG
jgi:hypothetical protein